MKKLFNNLTMKSHKWDDSCAKPKGISSHGTITFKKINQSCEQIMLKNK